MRSELAAAGLRVRGSVAGCKNTGRATLSGEGGSGALGGAGSPPSLCEDRDGLVAGRGGS